MPYPLGGRARVLLVIVLGPSARDEDDASRALNAMELYHSQVTRVEGPFPLWILHRSWGLTQIQPKAVSPQRPEEKPARGRQPQASRTTRGR